MNPFLALLDLPRRLHKPQVRDLAWTICSPPLLSVAPWPQRHPLAGSDWAAAPDRLEQWLIDLDHAPQPLLLWLAQTSTRRLGMYYERLWQYVLRSAPGIELLAANLQIREGGQTLGELDIVLRDRDGVHHLELAIKLYLGEQDADLRDPLSWLGPGSQDRLGLKLGHLTGHQLPMAARPQSVMTLAALGIAQCQSHLWLAGYLFSPGDANGAAPCGAHPLHLRGHWVHRRDWETYAGSRPAGHWQPLPREAWLATARCAGQDCWDLARFTAWRDALDPSARAQLLVRMVMDETGGYEAERVFLVADAWPKIDN